MATAPSSCLDLVSPTLLRNTTTTTLRAYFCEGFASSENLIKRLNETVKVRKCLDLFVIRTRFLVVVLLLLFAIIPRYSPRVFLRKQEGFASSENLIQRHTIQKTFIQNTQTEEDQMSAAANSAAYWRIAGMSYLKYANACAEIVRGALKEPHLSKVVLLLSLLSLSVRESIDPFSSSRSLSLLTPLSLSFKRLERGTRCTLKRRST